MPDSEVQQDDDQDVMAPAHACEDRRSTHSCCQKNPHPLTCLGAVVDCPAPGLDQTCFTRLKGTARMPD